jgi:hypothetical protein
MEGFERVHVPDATSSLAHEHSETSLQCVAMRRGLPSSRHEQDATRHAALRCLLRVTADDIRQRYAAPVSGILAPQPVSNLRIVTKL